MSEEDLKAAELRFQQAQLGSDVTMLDQLLHPDLTFVGPQGALSDKSADLQAHQSGAVRLDVLVARDLVVRVIDGVGVTVLTARMEGEFHGQAFAADMRYTRAWANDPAGWRIVAAHAGVIAPSAT